MKDPLEQVEVPLMRPIFWGALVTAVLVVYAVVFPQALTWVVAILALPVIIFLHELAHFVTAKRTGMKVTEFFVGFGPRVWSVRRGETEYGLKAFPLGGYCRIIGMTNVEDVPAADEPRAYRSKSYPAKVLVASAGSLMHFALATVLMMTLLVLDGNWNEASPTTTVNRVLDGSPAERAGLMEGDRIVSIDGETIDEWSDVSRVVRPLAGKEVTFVVERDGRLLDLEVTPEWADGGGRAGIAPRPHVPSVSIPGAFVEGPRQVWDIGVASVKALGERFSPAGIAEYVDAVVGNGEPGDGGTGSGGDADRFLSPVGGVRLGVQAVRAGWENAVFLLVAINVFVGIFNLVPLLPFDGGHIAIATYEAIASAIMRRRVRVDVTKLLPVTAAVVAILGLIFLSSLFLDITDPIQNPY